MCVCVCVCVCVCSEECLELLTVLSPPNETFFKGDPKTRPTVCNFVFPILLLLPVFSRSASKKRFFKISMGFTWLNKGLIIKLSLF